MSKVRSLNLFLLTMLIVGSIDSIRNMPATALFGHTLPFFFIIGTVLFLLPTALVSALLSSNMPDHNGIHDWVKTAMGDKLAFFVIWLQWINTMVWYPTILSFIAGIAAYLINPHLAQDKGYLIAVILGVFWTLTWLNLKGVHVSAKFSSVCAIFGMIVPVVAIVFLAIVWWVSDAPLQVHFSSAQFFPDFYHGQSWISLTAIITSFLGMELATVHVKNIENPQKIVPKSMLLSVVIIMLTMFFGSIAIAFVVPADKINLVEGVMQAFGMFFDAYRIHWLLPILGIMILVGSLGGMINWMISPAKGLLLAGQDGYLPKKLCYVNKNGVASHILVVQALLVSMVCVVFLLMPSVNGSYWLLTDLSTQLYVLMYVFMFIAALVLIARKFTLQPNAFQIPGKRLGANLTCLLGIGGCLIALAVGFIPPENINVGSFWHYERIFCCGIALMLLPALLLLIYKKTNS